MKKVLVYGLVFLTGFFLHACPRDKGQRPAPPVPVAAAPAVERAVPVQIGAIGTVEAFQSVSVKSQVTGSIRKILFREGQEVKKGDLLVELDCQPYDAALKQARANLARDRAQASYAREQAQRYAELVKKDYVARDEYDQTRANAASLEAAVKADEAQVESFRVQAGYCSITAPISGRIGRLQVDIGNIAEANATEITVINQIEPISVAFTIPEKSLAMVRQHSGGKRLQVEAVIPGDPAGPEKGELSFVDNAIDKATGTISLKAAFTNSARRLWPGQYVDVVLTLAVMPDAVLVPSRAVEQGPEGRYVFVVRKDRTVEMRPVTPGQAVGDETVIARGIAPGELVVTDGQLRLTPGARVTLRKAL